nr:hypothetical protein [Streptomyces sp. alain-838]
MAVQMRHEGVEQGITAFESQVPTYERSGWWVVDSDGQPIEKTTTAAKRRRAETEGEN